MIISGRPLPEDGRHIVRIDAPVSTDRMRSPRRRACSEERLIMLELSRSGPPSPDSDWAAVLANTILAERSRRTTPTESWSKTCRVTRLTPDNSSQPNRGVSSKNPFSEWQHQSPRNGGSFVMSARQVRRIAPTSCRRSMRRPAGPSARGAARAANRPCATRQPRQYRSRLPPP
jgi:hypothetical protein